MNTVVPSVEPFDLRLWDLVRQEDEHAFAQLYDMYAKPVYNFAFRRLASWSAAEEVVQSAFTTVWRRARVGDLPPLQRDSALPYFLGVAGRECDNAARGRNRATALARKSRFDLVEADHADAVAARVDDEAQMSEVLAIVRRLPQRQRDVLELVAWSGLSTAQAADALGLPEGTVKSRLSRARSQLRDMIGDRRGSVHD